ncbi:MAG: chorismate-binding protein [Candidatus Microthrix sp.]|nr:chorismate-binding protein [Candidatus Microthrix sp.]
MVLRRPPPTGPPVAGRRSGHGRRPSGATQRPARRAAPRRHAGDDRGDGADPDRPEQRVDRIPEGAEPPLHSGLVGYLGYDVVREVEHLPDTPLDDRGFPEAVQSVIGELAAYDHFSQRVTLIVNVVVPPDADEAMLDDLFDNAVAALDTLTADGARPLDEPLVHPPRSDDPVPPVRASLDETAYCQAVEVAKEHILDGDIFQVVLSTRYEFDLDADPFDVYRVLRQINPSPYMFFVRSRAGVGGLFTRAAGAAAGRPGDLPADRRHPLSGPHAGTRPQAGRRTGRASQGAGRAPDAGRPGPQRRGPGGPVRHLRGGGADDAGEVQPRHAPDQPGGRHPRRGQDPGRRARRHAARRHGVGRAQGAGDGVDRRARADQTGPLLGRGRLPGLLRQHRYGHRHPHEGDRPSPRPIHCPPWRGAVQAVRASSPTAIRPTSTWRPATGRRFWLPYQPPSG